jgi:predicted RNase H-like HicB family nuclease
MDIRLLVTFLTPFLPSLLNLGSKVFDGAIEELGADTFHKAQSIWAALSPKLKAKPTAQEAVTDLAAAPDNPDLQAVLRVQLQKLLSQEPALAETLTSILNEPEGDGTPGIQIVQRVIGNRNQVINQNYSTAITNIKGNVSIGRKQTQRFTAIIENENSGYVALCPELDIASQGDSIEEAKNNLIEALQLFFECADSSEIQNRLQTKMLVTQLEVAIG